MRYYHILTIVLVASIPVYVLGVFTSNVLAPSVEEEEQKNELDTIVFVGDMMFDRYIYEQAEQKGYEAILKNVKPILDVGDIVIGTLEGPISLFAPVAKPYDMSTDLIKFTFATTVASVLKEAGFDGISLGNNHILNFGDEGLEQTKYWLYKYGIGYFGAPDEPYVPLRTDEGTPSVVMYSFDAWYAWDPEKLAERIARERDDVFVVVYAHWGGGHESVPNPGQQTFARMFIDAGADLVVGSHPHVIQPKERHKDKWIYYSLGNFVYDQYFDSSHCGAVLIVEVEDDLSYTVAESFVTLNPDGTTRPSSCRTAVQDITR